ncbi:MAG: pantetheine-phosphate adenylyltransferase [Bacteroidia bacterium]|nr:pantetheine-phosphate adenylyltransferase [Bacteroidia bacterium]
MKTALFPGSFDPFHKGHEDIVNRILPLFDQVVIGIGNNTSKQYLFPLEKRKAIIQSVFRQNKQIEVAEYSGLTVDFCKKIKAGYIIRGLRHAGDFEFEQSIAQINQSLSAEVQTLFVPCRPELSAISSTILRDIYRNNGSVIEFLPLSARNLI